MALHLAPVATTVSWRGEVSAAARVCREAGGRVRVNVFVGDMDFIMPNANDGRTLEVVVDGLPLFGGRQLAVDTTLVGALLADGTARVGAANMDGVPLVAARRRKETSYPELVGPRSRCRLVVLGGEVGGRCSAETRSFLSQLAAARAREEVPLLQTRAEQAWRLHDLIMRFVKKPPQRKQPDAELTRLLGHKFGVRARYVEGRATGGPNTRDLQGEKRGEFIPTLASRQVTVTPTSIFFIRN